MGTRPHWTYTNQIWHKGSRGRCNHLFKILSKSVKGISELWGADNGVSRRLWQSPLQQVSTIKLPVISETWDLAMPLVTLWVMLSVQLGPQGLCTTRAVATLSAHLAAHQSPVRLLLCCWVGDVSLLRCLYQSAIIYFIYGFHFLPYSSVQLRSFIYTSLFTINDSR